MWKPGHLQSKHCCIYYCCIFVQFTGLFQIVMNLEIIFWNKHSILSTCDKTNNTQNTAAFVQFKKRRFLQNKRLFTVNIIVKEGNTLGGCFLDRLDRFYGRIFLHCHRTTSHLSKDRNYLPYLIHGYMTLGGRMTLEWPPFMYSDIFLVIFAGNFRQQRPQKSL